MTRIFHDQFLVGNGEWCPSCCPQGPPPDLEPERFRRGCNYCAGRGRVPFSAAEVVARTIAERLAAPPQATRSRKRR